MEASVYSEEIERLYRDGFHRYLRVAEAITGNPESGLDAVQEGFVRVLRYQSNFRCEARISTWVWKCLINAAKTARSHTNVILTADPVDDVVAQDEESPYIGLHDLIASLPERQRLVLFLRYYADMDYQAIAEILHIEMGTVGATLNKAYATLRRQLEEARHDELR